MTKLEQLEALRAGQKALVRLYEELKESDTQASSHRVTVLNVIRQDIGPVIADLTNEVEQEEFSRKTIAEICLEHGVHRTTLNKAIERGDIDARKSGNIWLIDDESEVFKQWLSGSKRGRPRFVKAAQS